ncbi:MAG: hypothetical protein QM781_06165 [Chitinophagaceae bacterium]
MSLQFTYILCGAGWADAMICAEDSRHEIPVSYLHDTLCELVSGMNQILGDEKESVDIHFVDEPGEHKVVLRALGSDDISLELFYSQAWSNLSESNAITYDLIFSTTSSKKHFAHLVLAVLENILEQYGKQGYREQWVNHDFPSEEYQKLKFRLS